MTQHRFEFRYRLAGEDRERKTIARGEDYQRVAAILAQAWKRPISEVTILRHQWPTGRTVKLD